MKLQLRNVFGKPVRVSAGNGVTKVDTLPEQGEQGKIYHNTTDGKYYVYDGSKYSEFGASLKIVDCGQYGTPYFVGEINVRYTGGTSTDENTAEPPSVNEYLTNTIDMEVDGEVKTLKLGDYYCLKSTDNALPLFETYAFGQNVETAPNSIYVSVLRNFGFITEIQDAIDSINLGVEEINDHLSEDVSSRVAYLNTVIDKQQEIDCRFIDTIVVQDDYAYEHAGVESGSIYIIYHIIVGITGEVRYDNALGKYISTTVPYCKVDVELPKPDTLYYMHGCGYYRLNNTFTYNNDSVIYYANSYSDLILGYGDDVGTDLINLRPTSFVNVSLNTHISKVQVQGNNYWDLTIPNYDYILNIRNVPIHGIIRKNTYISGQPLSYPVYTNLNYIGPQQLASTSNYRIMIYKSFLIIEQL